MKLKLFSILCLTAITGLLIACTSVEAPSRSTQIDLASSPTLAPLADTEETVDEPNEVAAAIQAPDTHEDSPTPGQPGDVIYDEAPVETAEIAILESFPVQVNLTVSGSFPDGCTTIDQVTQRQQDNTFFVNIITTRPAEAMCTEAIVPFEETIALDVRGLKAGEYAVVVNEVVQNSFELTVDNAMPNEDEPVQGVLPPADDTVYEQIFIPATGAAVSVPAEWQQTDYEWSPTSDGTPAIGLTWVEVDLEWTPTAMLPPEATLIAREAVTMTWGQAIQFQVELKDADGQLTQVERHLIGPLNENVVYDLYGRGATYQALEEVEAAYDMLVESVTIGATPTFAGLPESCTPNIARAIYVDTEQRYCLQYPVYFPKPVEQNNIVNISGLPQSEGPDPVVASLFIQIDGQAEGRNVVQVVDEVVSQVNDLPITRQQSTLDGEEAVIVEGLPGRFGSRQLFAVHDDTIYHIILMPVDDAFPQVSEEIETLWGTVTSSFTFLP
ncbi:MAG: hypothetical protein KDJ65_18480 [Anaerolineae bacterium]|nr:hypothetical protein [Anaerolineae bacterium]